MCVKVKLLKDCAGDSFLPLLTSSLGQEMEGCAVHDFYPIQRVSCGLFGVSEDHVEKFLSLDAHFIKNKASTFFFRATGNSMEPLVFANDVLIVDRSITATRNKVVVVSVDSEMLCKRLLSFGDKIILRSENSSFRDIEINEEHDFLVFGVVTGIARDVY